jgi:phospholipid/cholesterol/gamma-HCH transport system permease protein
LRRKYGRNFKLSNLPESARNIEKLFSIAAAATPRGNFWSQPPFKRFSYRERGEAWAMSLGKSLHSAISFLGEIFTGFFAFAKGGRIHFRVEDWLKQFHEVGWRALPIVALISFLVGLIVAFVSAVQLERFGATIYVADLVGLSMAREMGALMTGIIMAGRTGAAYAAQIGSMKRSEELDALRTMGLNPVEMVVIPRVVALTCMIPLLSVFAVFLGIFAGLVICDGFFDLSSTQFLDELARSVGIKELLIGFIKAIFYGFLVAFAGAWRGVRCGDSADAVGKAATSAVVLGITLIIVADGLFAVLLNALHL